MIYCLKNFLKLLITKNWIAVMSRSKRFRCIFCLVHVEVNRDVQGWRLLDKQTKTKKLHSVIKGQSVKPVGKTLAPEKRLERDSVVGSGVGSFLANPLSQSIRPVLLCSGNFKRKCFSTSLLFSQLTLHPRILANWCNDITNLICCI